MSYREQAEFLVRKNGTVNEVERLDAGVLPEDELDKIVSDVLFAPILDLPVRRKAKEDGVRKNAIRLGLAVEGDGVRFRVIDEEELDALAGEEWETLKKIRERMPQAVVKTFAVEVECGRYRRTSKYAKVEVQLGERTRRLDVVLNPSEHQKGRHKSPEVVVRRPGRQERAYSLEAPEEPVDYSKPITARQLNGNKD